MPRPLSLAIALLLLTTPVTVWACGNAMMEGTQAPPWYMSSWFIGGALVLIAVAVFYTLMRGASAPSSWDEPEIDS